MWILESLALWFKQYCILQTNGVLFIDLKAYKDLFRLFVVFLYMFLQISLVQNLSLLIFKSREI